MHNELRNRYLHVDYPVQSEETGDSKSKICTLNCTLEELAALCLLKADSKATWPAATANETAGGRC